MTPEIVFRDSSSPRNEVNYVIRGHKIPKVPELSAVLDCILVVWSESCPLVVDALLAEDEGSQPS